MTQEKQQRINWVQSEMLLNSSDCYLMEVISIPKSIKLNTKRNSYTVNHRVDGASTFGQIKFFLKVDALLNGQTSFLAVLEPFQVIERTTYLPCHFCRVKEL